MDTDRGVIPNWVGTHQWAADSLSRSSCSSGVRRCPPTTIMGMPAAIKEALTPRSIKPKPGSLFAAMSKTAPTGRARIPRLSITAPPATRPGLLRGPRRGRGMFNRYGSSVAARGESMSSTNVCRRVGALTGAVVDGPVALCGPVTGLDPSAASPDARVHHRGDGASRDLSGASVSEANRDAVRWVVFYDRSLQSSATLEHDDVHIGRHREMGHEHDRHGERRTLQGSRHICMGKCHSRLLGRGPHVSRNRGTKDRSDGYRECRVVVSGPAVPSGAFGTVGFPRPNKYPSAIDCSNASVENSPTLK